MRQVLVIEDQTVFREMLVEILQLDSFDVVGACETGQQGLAFLAASKVDLAVVDILLPDINGLDVLRTIREQYSTTRVVVVTAQAKPAVITEAFTHGAHGIVTKGSSLAELRESLRRVAFGGTFYCSTTNETLRQRGGLDTDEPLSAREREIVRLVAMGCSSKDIADKLNIAAKTVQNHRYRIAQKLGFADIAGLTRYAINHGWVADD